MDDFDFDSGATNPKKFRATAKQISFMETILQSYPSLPRPTDLSRNGLRQWLDVHATAIQAARDSADTGLLLDTYAGPADFDLSAGEFWDHSLDSLATDLDV